MRGNIFQASAILLERLQAAAVQPTVETRPLVPLNVNECDLRPVLAAVEAFLIECRTADERAKFDDGGALHILGGARRRLGESLTPFVRPDGLTGDDATVGAIKALLVLVDETRADSHVERVEAIIAALKAALPAEAETVNEQGQPTKPSRKRRRKIVVDLGASSVTIDGKLFELSPYHAQMLNALVHAKGRHVTGPKLQDLPGCMGKNIYREIRSLKELVPPLATLIKSGRNRGYFLVR